MTDKKEDFKSFQIGSLGGPQRPASPAATPASSASAAAPASTEPAERIFPTLEGLIESEAIEEIGGQMRQTVEKLDEIIAQRTGRAKQEAQKAKIAYDRVFDLIDHLLQVKATMLNSKENQKN